MDVNPKIETLPAWVSAGRRQVVPMAELPDVFPKVYGDVAEAAATAGVALVGPAYALYFGMPGDTVDVEIGFGIDRVSDVPGLVVTERPETRAAVGTHVGPYSELGAAYEKFMPWLAEQRLQLTNDMFEFYDSEPDEPPESTITRMVFPLADT